MTTMPLELEARALRVKVEQQEQHIRKLTRRLRERSQEARRARSGYDTALLMAAYHAGYLPTSRRFMRDNAGMTRSQHQNALGLLRLARVIDHNCNWLIHDVGTIEARLQRALETVVDAPGALYSRLPDSAKRHHV